MIKFENKSNERFYYLSVHCDILAHTVLTATRGGKNITVVSVIAKGNTEVINKKILQITKLRLSRGYELVL